MSSVERAARAVKMLKDEEWKALLALERATESVGPTDEGVLARLSRLPRERMRFALGELAKKELVRRTGVNYSLTRLSMEALALREYSKRDLVVALGAIIARGKESDVYEAFDPKGGLYALKFFELGRTSFTAVRRRRSFEQGRVNSWLRLNYEAAKREYSALKKLHGLSHSFPRAVAFDRNTVLLEELSGVRLSTRPDLEDPKDAIFKILSAVKTAYLDAHLVNADLSEYNVLTDGSRFWLIDWPQAVESNHPNAGELLRHDVSTITSFFRRAYGVGVEVKSALDFIEDKSAELEQD